MGINSYDQSPVKHLPIKALILSALLHGAVMSLFVFVFPLYQSPMTPIVNFLGSSLSKHEFLPHQNVNGSPSSKMPPINFLKSLSKKNKAPFPERNNSKPPVIQSLDPDLKITLKSTFLEKNMATNNVETTDHKNNLFNIEPYTPLKLNQQ
ncbi:hypothetical protein ACFL49_03670 [Candidatus Omnitrophota bacterium]